MKSEHAQDMLKEIKEEASIFASILAEKEKYVSGFVKLFKSRNFKRIYLVGNGSPGWAAMTLKYAATDILKVDATYSTPGLFLHHDGFDVSGVYKKEEILLICPAESGRTKGPVLIARKAKELGIPVVSTTLEPEGVLAAESDVVIFKPSRREYGLPSTKGHSTGIFLFLLAFVEAAHETGRISEGEYGEYMAGLNRLPETVLNAYECTLEWFDRYMDLIMNCGRFHLLGYGANYGTVNEIVLKFVESHKKPSIAVELEEFMHGHIRSISSDELIVMICAEEGPERERMLKLYDLLIEEKVGMGCLLLHSTQDNFSKSLELTINATNVKYVNCLEYLVPLQILAFQISDHLGLDMSVSVHLALKHVMEPSFVSPDQAEDN